MTSDTKATPTDKPSHEQSEQIRAVFQQLQKGEYAPRLHNTTGAYHFQISDVGNWDLTVDQGQIRFGKPSKPMPECTIRAGAKDFLAIMSSEANAFSAAMRGDIEIWGDAILMTKFSRAAGAPWQMRH